MFSQTVAMKLFLILLSLAVALPAQASSSDWQEAEGGRVRLVTTGIPDAEGKLSGILDIRLEPGWKTYWREPGGSGVPPTLDLAGGGKAELQFPAPEWHHDGTDDWAGYSQSVALPVVLTLSDPKRPAAITATAFIGICETICVPLKAELTVDPWSAPDNPVDAFAVAAAKASLPEQATSEFGLGSIKFDADRVVFTATLPNQDEAELFLAGSEGFMFMKPELKREGGKTSFTAKMSTYLKAKPRDAKIYYTLKTPLRSVSGTIPF